MPEKRIPQESRRTKLKRAADRLEAAKLHAQGMPSTEIAIRLGVDQSTVSRDLKFVRNMWLEAAAEEIAVMRATQLARYEMMYREIYRAWENSVNANRPSSYHMGRMIEVMEAINKLMGLNAPARQVNYDLDFSKLSDEQVSRIAAGEHPVTVLATSSNR